MNRIIISAALTVILSAPAYSKSKEAADAALQQSTTPTAAPCVSWVNPIGKPKAALLCIHGLGLYSGAYANFGQRLSKLGIAVYAIDVRGFGSWMKSEGHTEVNFSDCLNDVRTTLQSIRSANPGIPVFLLGESMGGAIALQATALWPDLVDGLISSVPAGERFKQKKTDLKVALELLTGPNKQHDIGKSVVDQATKDSKLRDDWQSNPLDRMDLSAKELLQFQKFMNANHDAATKIVKTPILMVQGNKDKLVKPEGTWELFNEIESEQKTFMAVPSEHLIFEDQQDKDKEFDTRIDRLAAEWILTHVQDHGPIALAPSGVRNPALTGIISSIVAGQYSDSITALQTFLKTEPNNGEAHYWLGIALKRSNKPVLARREFVTAMSLENSAGHAQEANKILLSMADDNAYASRLTTDKTSTAQSYAGITKGSPTVLVFCAPWCDLCTNEGNLLKRAQSTFGNGVKFSMIDVTDNTNQEVIKALNVGPIPTVVYLTAGGRVASTSIGKSDFATLAKGVTAILPKGQPARLQRPVQQ